MPTSSGFAGTLNRRRKNGNARSPRDELGGQCHFRSTSKLDIALPIVLACCLLFVSGCKRQSPSVPTPAALTTTVESAAPTALPTLEASDVATGQPLATNNALNNATENSIASATWAPLGTWTTQRLVALAETGPIVIDLSVSVGSASLHEVNDQLLVAAAAELLTQIPADDSSAAQDGDDGSMRETVTNEITNLSAVTWQRLLDLPLIRSGWLGNLVAMAEQNSQLIQQYDEDHDTKVSAQELRMFLSRGLERTAPLQVNDIGQVSDRQSTGSPWGSGDRNQDHALDASERDTFAEALVHGDLNGDGVVTIGEWADPDVDEVQRNMMTGRRGNSFLQNQTLLVLDDADELKAPKAARKLANDLLRHYTFLAELPRAQWSGWSDQQWQTIDSNHDQLVDPKELTQLATIPAQARIFLRWPATERVPADNDDGAAMATTTIESSPSESMELHVLIDEANGHWHARAGGDGGALTCGDFSLNLTALDGFTRAGKQLWRQQIMQAFQNPQFKMFVISRLELQPDAFDVLDADQDQILSDAEFTRAWRWLSVRQAARVNAQWGLSSQSAFQLFDIDGDQRLSPPEIAAVAARLRTLDRDGDGSIAPNELPLVVSLSASRTDRRLQELPAGGATQFPVVDSDWFSAMDVNRDANIGGGEFLGERSDFERLDSNGDGFITRSEIATSSSQ